MIFRHSMIRVWVMSNQFGEHFQVLVNQHLHATHHHIQERIIWEILRAQKWRFSIGHCQTYEPVNVFYVFGKIDHHLQSSIQIFFTRSATTYLLRIMMAGMPIHQVIIRTFRSCPSKTMVAMNDLIYLATEQVLWK